MTQWPDPRTSLGHRTWPQWRGWQHCAVTGDLIAPNGHAWTPEALHGAAWLMQCWELRNRLIYADSAVQVPLLRSADMKPPTAFAIRAREPGASPVNCSAR